MKINEIMRFIFKNKYYELLRETELLVGQNALTMKINEIMRLIFISQTKL